ncbi:MAG: universal stress protein [Nevskia sp.]|nr:universal stress protein [Nevskia sp.]
MYKVLLPFDSSDASLKAVQFAVKLRELLSAPVRVDLLHVEGTPHNFGDFNGQALLEHMRKELTDHGNAVLDKADGPLKAAKIETSRTVEFGNAAAVIAEVAQRLGSDHIVMGTHGLGGIGSLLLGSVAMKVVQQSKVPVTLVK